MIREQRCALHNCDSLPSHNLSPPTPPTHTYGMTQPPCQSSQERTRVARLRELHAKRHQWNNLDLPAIESDLKYSRLLQFPRLRLLPCVECCLDENGNPKARLS